MSFFRKVKIKLESALMDLTTIEHVLIVEESNGVLYRLQQTGGDSIAYIKIDQDDEELLELFNEAFITSIDARTGIGQFIIECLT